jgi:vancomycin resistance protein YoaR
MIAQIKQQVTTQQLVKLLVIAGVSCFLTGLILLGNSYNNRLFPNTYINSIDVSGLHLLNSITLLDGYNQNLDTHVLTLQTDDISLSSGSAELGYSIDFTSAVEEIYAQQHDKDPVVTALRALTSFFQKKHYIAQKTYDSEKLNQFFEIFNQKVEIVGEEPSVELKVSGSPKSIVVFPGKPGRELDEAKTSEVILDSIQTDQYLVEAQIASTSGELSKEDIELVVERAEIFTDKQLTLTADDHKFYLTDQDLVTFINPLGGYSKTNILSQIDKWAETINRPAPNAVFEYNQDTLEVEEFVPHKDGLEVDKDASTDLISDWLEEVELAQADEAEQTAESAQTENAQTDPPPTSLALIFQRTSPEFTLDKTNDLGINERIGFGESYYYHSIPNRIYNVGLTAGRISYTIVPPGKEFSFNKTLGDVSAETGFRSAYVISGGQTVLGDGGGVCQVSSTLFRSVMDAGLDITKRLQHSYRVSYYELNSDPGFDATVYAGDIDFRFVNDTPGHIIVVANNDPKNLYLNIEIYGTDDGRVSEISNYKKWGWVGAPPAEYFPTAELPSGLKKQIDWAVSGIKAEFTYTVKDKDGNIIHNNTYYSNYRPWSAKYMVGI